MTKVSFWAGVRRENWIKAKEVEAKRGSRQEVDEEEEEAPRYQQQQQSNHEQHEEEEVAAGEEEEWRHCNVTTNRLPCSSYFKTAVVMPVGTNKKRDFYEVCDNFSNL